eukprot:1693742-Pyramimonas_sp.AAC.1
MLARRLLVTSSTTPSGAGLQRFIALVAKQHLTPHPLWNSLLVRLVLAYPDIRCDGVTKIPASRWSHITKYLRSCSTSWAM